MLAPMLSIFDRPERIEKRVEPTFSMANSGESEIIKTGDAIDLFADIPTAAGARVNEKTAMRISAVYAAVSLIAGAVAMLSFPVYRRTDTGRERVDGHPLWKFFNLESAPAWSAAATWELLLTQMLLRGDGLAFLDRNQGGQIRSVIPIPRGQWQVKREDAPRAGQPGRLKYAIQFEEGARGVQQEDVLHFPGFGFDGECGMSVIQWGARAAAGIAIKGDEWAGKFFGRGAQPAHAVKAPGEMNSEQQADFREAWDRAYSGQGPTGRPLILTEGLDVKELSMSAKDAQMLEARQWQVIDIARAFRVPPHMIGETTNATSFGTGIEQMGIGFTIYTLGPHLKRIQQELNRKLFKDSDLFIEPDMRSLMRGDNAARSDFYAKALGGTQAPAWMTPNEVRRAENMPPHPDGENLSRPQETPSEAE